MNISRHVKASTLEVVNLGMMKDPQPVSIASELKPTNKATMIALLKDYQYLFAWSHKDMKGLNPKFYQHQIHLSKDAKPVKLWRY